MYCGGLSVRCVPDGDANEFLLVLDDGMSNDDDADSKKSRPKGAYYQNIERKMLLKKKRVNVCVLLCQAMLVADLCI